MFYVLNNCYEKIHKNFSLNKIFLRVRGLANSFLSKFVHSINQIIILWTMYLNISMAFSKA